MTFIIAVCPECKHYTVPLVLELDADPPHCVNCIRSKRGNVGIRNTITIADLKKAPKMRLIEVVPKQPTFRKKKQQKLAA